MRSLIGLVFAGAVLFLPSVASAATYYVDATGGNDSNNGTASTTAWQTLTKVNGSTFAPGDFILFKRGVTFMGNLVVGQSGTSGKPSTIGAYGSGGRPLLNAAGNNHGVDIRTNKSYITIQGLDVRGATLNQILLLSSVSNVIITDCYVVGGSNGAYTLQTGNFSNVLISDSYATGYTGTGVRLQTSTSFTDVTIDNVIASSTIGTSGFASSAATTTRLSIIDSDFSHHVSHGINIPSATSTDFIIRNSTTTDNGGTGIQIGGGAKAGTELSGIYSAGNDVSGLNFTLGTGSVHSDIDIEDSVFEGNASNGIAISSGSSGAFMSDLSITKVVASDNGGDGILFSGNGDELAFTDITANGNGGSGVVFSTSGSAGMTDVSLIDSQTSDNGVNGVSFSGSGTGSNGTVMDIVAERNLNDGYNVHGAWSNVIFDRTSAIENGVDGDGADGDGYSYHDSSSGIIRNSIARDNKKSAIAQVGTASTTIYNNLFTHETNGTLPLVALLDGTTHSVYNNTLYCAAQTGTGLSIDETSTVTVHNNIVHGFDLGIRKAATATLVEDYNLAYGAGTANFSDFTQGPHSLSADPRFSDPEEDDFRLEGSSPAINAGTSTPYAATDILGNPVYGPARDIGAYEYQSEPDVIDSEDEDEGGSSRSGQRRSSPSPLSDSAIAAGTQGDVSSLILSNRSLFTAAKEQGIVLPAFVLQILGFTAPVPSFIRDLTIGSSGADVIALQTTLISKGFSIPAGATGYFGEQTRAALAEYQAANGIMPAAGYFGPKTRAVLN